MISYHDVIKFGLVCFDFGLSRCGSGSGFFSSFGCLCSLCSSFGSAGISKRG